MKGKIVRIIEDKGFGFIHAEGTDYFFHHSAVKNDTLGAHLLDRTCEFEDTEGVKGPRAEDIYID